ncbi:MAG: helix-turn-helix domain-containing protein [Clostridia bacterium]|nr:helix-turn-helix domain-containing protein [Clostridia bacterium]
MISYEPFWETLKRRGESTYSLINRYGISSATINRMRKGEGITTQKINDFCKILKCTVSDIIEYKDE